MPSSYFAWRSSIQECCCLPWRMENILCSSTISGSLLPPSQREFRQRFFPAECTQCLYGHCQVETRRHIFANCCRFAHFPLTDLVPTVKDFVKFLKEHPSAFAFPSQDHPPVEPLEPPWVSHLVSFLCAANSFSVSSLSFIWLCILGMIGLLTWTCYSKVGYEQPVSSSLSS